MGKTAAKDDEEWKRKMLKARLCVSRRRLQRDVSVQVDEF